MRNTTYSVECYVHPSQSLFHMSLVYCGLIGLAQYGNIELSYQRSKPVSDTGGPPWMSWLAIEKCSTGERRIIHFDLEDRSDVVSMSALEDCDVYFKRSYYPPDLSALPVHLRNKVAPFGLNFGCRTRQSTWQILPRVIPLMFIEVCRSPGQLSRWGRRDLNNIRAFLGTLPIGDYEQSPSHPLNTVVMFQTRVWSPGEMKSDVEEETNQPRADLARRLKREFRSRFWGGLVATPHAKRYYPDAITNLPSRRSQYIALSKRALIGVYTRGLHDSLAFKLPEYLAASKCIVGEALRNELPTPLVPDVHYLRFASADECVEQCTRLLEDSHLAEEMRYDNWEYYQSEVRPVRLLTKCLERAFELPKISVIS